MKIKIELTDTFYTSIERAFKAPILGDATKFLNGYRFQPPITGFEEDETWGQVNGIRYLVTSGNFWLSRGRLFTDKILSRNENEFWKWTIYDFKIRLMFFTWKAIGEWKVLERGPNRIEVNYSYTFYSKNIFLHLCTMLFCSVQWKGMMRKAIKGIKLQAESKLPFVYER